MYTINQIILVADRTLFDVSGEVVYEREWHGKRVFTTDARPHDDMGTAITYGRLFFDSQNQPVIVPGIWSDEDAKHAKNAIWPLLELAIS